MTRGILIAGNGSSLTAAIAAEAAKRVEHFAAALLPGRPGSEKGPSLPESQIPLQWNPGSSISARTLVLAAENRLGQINEAVLVCTPPALRCRPAELSPVEAETMIEENIKGWFFLTRELALVFGAKKTGTLALVFPEPGGGGGRDEAADLLGPPATAAFRAFTQSLLASAAAEEWQTMGFSCSETGEEAAFASFIFKRLDEGNRRDNGKLHRWGKFNFFGKK